MNLADATAPVPVAFSMASASTAIPPIPSADPRGGRFTVLLGDEQDAAEAWHRTAQGLLASQGVMTLVASSGREALGLIEDSAFGRGPRIHVAVLDQHMPIMGGLQILRRLQRDLSEAAQSSAPLRRAAAQARAVPPAILLADSLARGTMQEALTVQVFSVLPRPVELNLLLDSLARALRRFYQNKWPEEGLRNAE